jgi:geranylgeranyl pyrophosphate synthase
MKFNPTIETALNIIYERGSKSLEDACNEISQFQNNADTVSDALKYYAEKIFPRVLPIFPALISITCELVGGKPEKIRSLAASMLLITASGDVHDDIIDKSTYKFRRKTVYGKYGNSIALLAGDVLLVKGLTLLEKNCEALFPEERRLIIDLVNESFFEIVKAEAIETCLWRKSNVTPKEYFEVIRLKGCVAELQSQIGAILGSADQKSLEFVKSYGRTIGILSTMNDEFMDMSDFSELQHRFKYELPPYPMICAFRNKAIKEQFQLLTSKDQFSKQDLKRLISAVMKSKEVQKIRSDLITLSEKELENNILLKNTKKGREAVVLLQALASNI